MFAKYLTQNNVSSNLPVTSEYPYQTFLTRSEFLDNRSLDAISHIRCVSTSVHALAQLIPMPVMDILSSSTQARKSHLLAIPNVESHQQNKSSSLIFIFTAELNASNKSSALNNFNYSQHHFLLIVKLIKLM